MLLEHNVVVKDPLKIGLRFASCYPNLYRSAMSSLGFHIIYDFLNHQDDVYCERVVYPYGKSLETGSPLKDFDVVGFSLQYEQDYPHVLEMLREGGLNIRKRDRGPDDPLVIAGGPCASSNPLPMSDFIDLFLVGDGEVILPDFLDKLGELDNPRREIDALLDVEGVFIPGNEAKLVKVEDMRDAWRPVRQVFPETDNKDLIPAFGKSFLLEVSRGCARGCRFCMAGCLYRPRRETDIKTLIQTAEEGREATGLNKIALIGGAVSDYSHIEELCSELLQRGFQVTTPSLRIESISRDLLESLKESGLRTITIAPESTWRLRKVANKPITDEDIRRTMETAFAMNFNVKLYFLVGLPTETQDDLQDLLNLIRDLEVMAPHRDSLRISINPFIPKPHTPFQWTKFNLKDIKARVNYLKKHTKNRHFKVENPNKSLMQYVLSVGDADLAHIIEESSHKKVPLGDWKKLTPHWNLDDELPWKDLDVNIDDEFLEDEYKKALNGDLTPWCETFGCYHCGVCQ
ncbi:radical SAM protein [Methanobacterium sp.]|uniref:radical SAM protein n=1 Tax=Methanobacterium sp. TaxID=2164 RepID=UPI002ABAA914|nr:radical SAM protein [Methanobacterium sp.]MDY9922719.1 radical SAM protein [Methanobacterium sp.]